MYSRLIIILACGWLFTACDNQTNNDQQDTPEATASAYAPADTPSPSASGKPAEYYQSRFNKIIYGQAHLIDVREALTDRDIGSLTNTMHALYSMRWHRGVNHLLSDMWKLDKTRFPEISWDLIEKPPVRLALASTMNRIQTGGSREFVEYLRTHKNEKHEFDVAQVVVGLGFNGDPADVDYIEQQARGSNHYIVQSSLTALSLLNHPTARDALGKIAVDFKDDPRSRLAHELLNQAYKVEVQEPVADQPPATEATAE